jgi:hypothetical protein
MIRQQAAEQPDPLCWLQKQTRDRSSAFSLFLDKVGAGAHLQPVPVTAAVLIGIYLASSGLTTALQH